MRRLMLALVMVVLTAGSASAAEAPRDIIDKFYGSLLSVMKSGPQLGFQGRFDALLPTIDGAFDMPEMTRLSLGAAAKTLSPEQMAQVTDAFRRYTVANYASSFNEFNGEKFVVGTPRQTESGTVVVPSTLVPGDGTPSVSLDYVMRQEGGKWGVTDILAEGAVSQMALRRSEFVSVLRRDGFQALLDSIRKKTDAMASKH